MSALPSSNSSWSNETYFQQEIENGSSSTTSSRCFVNDNSAIKALKVASYSILILISLLGNSLVVAVVYRYKNMRRKTTNIFIANMAVADLIITTIYMPRLIAMYVIGITWIGGTLGLILCKIIPSLHGVSLLISILTILLISIERLYTIVFPLKYNFASERPKTTMAVVWVVGLLARIPYVLALRTVVYKSGQIVCSSRLERFFSEPEAHHIYYLTLLVAFYALPLVLIIVSYLVIIMYLRRCRSPGATLTSQQLDERRLKAIRNVLRMMIVVTVAFIVCWITYFVALLVVEKTSCALKFWRLFLAHSNSVLNPCIYLYFNRDFRRGFVNISFGLFKAEKTEVQGRNCTPYRNQRYLGREKAATAKLRQGNVRPTKKTDVNMEMVSKDMAENISKNRRAGQRKK